MRDMCGAVNSKNAKTARISNKNLEKRGIFASI